MDLVLTEVDVALGCRVGGQNRENNFLVLITGNRTDQKNVGLIVAVLGEVDPFGFFLDLIGPAILGGQGEAIRQLNDSTNLETNIAAIGTDFLKTILIGNFDGGLENTVRKD